MPEVTFTIDRSLVDETVGTTELQLKLSKRSGEDVIVKYDALDGDGVAESPTDFTFVVPSREVTIPAGDTRAVIPVKILNDGMEEDEEHVEIELTLVQHAVLGATRRHTLRISNNILPRARFSQPSSAALENGAPQVFRVELNTPPDTDVVLLRTLGAATAGPADHGVVDGMITIPRGQLSVDIPALIQDDPTDEDDETFDVTLSGLEGVVVADGGSHGHTIMDNDDPPQIGFTVAASATSEAAAAQIEVKLGLASEKEIKVDYAITGVTAGLADLTLASGTLVFPIGTTAKTVDVTINNDELDELDETASVVLSNPVNATLGTTQHTLTITDNDDPPTISFMQGTSTVSEGAGTSQVQVVLSGPSGRNIQFSVDRGGTAGSEDLTLPTLPLTILAGGTSATIVSTITNDQTDEVNETVALTLADVVLATPAGTTTHTITITDNDDPPSVRFDPTVVNRNVDEGDSGQAEFLYPVLLSAPSSKTVTVNIDGNDGDATNGIDFEYGAGTLALTFLPGEIGKAVRVIVFGDPSPENDNDVRMRLLTPMNASNAQDNQTRTHTINNDD